MKSLLTQDGALTPLHQKRNASLSSTARRMAVAVLACVGVLALAKPGQALVRYRIAITPVNDPSTGNFKVRIDGARTLTAHVVKATDGADDGKDASGVTVYFYTNLGSSSLSNAQGTTNSAGVAGVTLDGGWKPGTATVRAKVFDTKGGEYSDVALVPVVAPDGETTRISYRIAQVTHFSQKLTPERSDVNFSGLEVQERDGGDGVDYCYRPNVAGEPTPFLTVTGGRWSVGNSNDWGDDKLSWATSKIEYYRQSGRTLPCTAFVTQYMDVVRPGYSEGNLYYTSNSSRLANTIGTDTVANVRDSVTDTIPFP